MSERELPPCALGVTGARLAAWRSQALSARKMARISAHVPQCPSCQALVAQFDTISRQLRDLPELDPGQRVWRQVRQRITTTPMERRPPMRTRSWWTGAGIALAALVFFGILTQLQHRPTTTPGGGVTATIALTPTVAPFAVTGVDLAVTPPSVAGIACGTTITVTYTATLHIAPNGPGGVIQLMYTTTNGRGSTNATVTVTPGQTTATYTFAQTGALPADHTFPGIGEVIVNSPTAISSQGIAPSGQCH